MTFFNDWRDGGPYQACARVGSQPADDGFEALPVPVDMLLVGSRLRVSAKVVKTGSSGRCLLSEILKML